MAHEWEGVLIEAVPQLFAELQLNLKKKNGRLWSGLKLVNKALTASESVSSVNISVNLDPNGAAWMRGTGSIVRGAEKRTILTVPAATLPKILQDDPPFDVVQIDVEGFDEVVLQQLESLKWEPLVLALETCNDVCQKYRLAHNFSASDAPGNVVLFKSHLIKKTQTS
jgi:FkbM family methyltransferase